ncbi:RIB43A-like with coiled-coils protein 2 [Fundulus diaphanus]
MFNVELISERVARENLERRREREARRRERIFDHKVRTIGVDKDALDMQLQEKKRREEAAKREENAYDAHVHQYNKAACLIQRRQEKEKRMMEKATAHFWHQNQKFDPNDPDGSGKAEAQMVLPGLVGEEPDRESRLQRQREQLRDWLLQQQDELEEHRHQQKMEELHYDQSREEMDNKALELEKLEMERRKAASMATTNYNLAKIEEQRRQERERSDEGCTRSAVGVPGLCHSRDRRAPPETLQQVLQFQQGQVEEKKRMELEKKREEEHCHRLQLDSARKALLMDRQQARLEKQLRRHLDSVNVQLAQTHMQERPDRNGGHAEDGFFSKFNTCSR